MGDRGFRFGDWQIDPDSNTLSNGTAQAQLEPRAMDVLRYLCRHPGAVIPTEEILEACWGSSEMGDNPIHKAITQLRRALGDSASEPRYIETVRKRGYRAIAAVIANEAAEEGSWLQGSPFRGLEAFQENHAAIFFGRMQACSQLRELVTKQTEQGSAMALVLGPSGSGKTSLVRAGLLPQLMEAQAGPTSPIALACTLYMDCADLAEGNLFQALAAVLIDAELDGKLLFSGESAEALGKQLESSGAETIAGRFERIAGRVQISLFVDRLEAIFRASGVTDEVRSRFIALLEQLSHSNSTLVILACRNDFYPELVALPSLMALKARGGYFDLNPPDGADIAQMVRMPARAAQLKFEQDPTTGANLDDVLCDAAHGNPDILPLLQYCLNELYRQRSEDSMLRFQVFQQLGGIEGSIAVRAEQVVTALVPSQRAALSHVLSLLVGVSEEQSSVTARRAAWSALQGADARELVRALVEARLFVSELTGDIPSFGVAHEALLRRWPRVVEWIEQHRDALQIRTRISQDAARWDASGRPKDLLVPRGSHINQARSLLELTGFSLSQKDRDYVHSSLARVRIGERIRVIIAVLLCGLTLLSGILGINAHSARRDAEQHRTEVESLMGYMLGEFAEKLRPLGKLDLLDDVSKKALAYLTGTQLSGASQIASSQRVKALQVLAEVNIARANPEKALEALLAARSILRYLHKEAPSDKNIIKDFGANSFYLGKLHFNRSEWIESKIYFEDYKRLSNILLSLNPDDLESKIELAYANNSVGGVAIRQGDLSTAIKCFTESTKLQTTALSENPSNGKLSADLANSISWLADAKVKLGHIKESMELYSRETQLLTALHNSAPTNALWSHGLALANWRQGELNFALGQTDLGRIRMQTAEEVLDQLISQDSSNKNWQLDRHAVALKILEYSVGNTLKRKLDSQSKLHNSLKILRDQDPKRTRVTHLLATSGQGIASTYLRLAQPDKASEYIELALLDIKPLVEKNQTDPIINLAYANTLISQSDLYNLIGKPSDAQKVCIEANAVLKKLKNGETDYRILSTWVRSNHCAFNHADTAEKMQNLKRISYQDANYISFINSHPPKKDAP